VKSIHFESYEKLDENTYFKRMCNTGVHNTDIELFKMSTTKANDFCTFFFLFFEMASGGRFWYIFYSMVYQS